MTKYDWTAKACAIFLLWAATAVVLPAQTFTLLHNFTGADGAVPQAPLLQAADGNFYGSATQGGMGCPETGCGTIFSMTPSGALTTLYLFTGGSDGSGPAAALIQAHQGKFYGTTVAGTIFRITSNGTLTTLYTLDNAEGYAPYGIVRHTNGNYYGIAASGGTYGDGTIFRVTPNGTLTILHNFDGTDGLYPQGALVEGTDGNLYGTTFDGGTTGCGGRGCGTIFKITTGGTLTTLYIFTDGSDGARPTAGLVQGADGNFYGTASEGGSGGTVFKITPSGQETTLHEFNGTDGSEPIAALVQGTDGNFYGSTYGSRTYYNGTIFQITPSGTFTTVHAFDGTDGSQPWAALIQATDGSFYGTTAAGGSYHEGTVFSLSMGLGPFVETNPAGARVGRKVGILGTDLTGATSVTFNGTAAKFTVKSPTLIIATVPNGATTGTVKVKLPGGTLSSNAPFYVLK